VHVELGAQILSLIAVVIANKLLYVVDNDAKIETGRMQILLEGYSDQQLNRIKESIQAKK
jgi:sulfur transfer protein SufE